MSNEQKQQAFETWWSDWGDTARETLSLKGACKKAFMDGILEAEGEAVDSGSMS